MLGESAFKFPIEISNRLNKLKYIKSSLNLYKINFLLKKFKYSEEEMKNINIFYIDSEDDKNLILNDNDLKQFIFEKMIKDELLINMKLEIYKDKKDNNENIIFI